MNRKLAVLVTLTLVAVPLGVAQANLVTFRMHSDLFSGPTGPSQVAAFDAATGGGNANRDVITTFTIDTTAPLGRSSWIGDAYLFDQPGTGMSATVGNLTIFYSDFGLALGPNLLTGGANCEGLVLFSGPQGPLEHGSEFQMSDCGRGHPLANDSLNSFASSDLSAFHDVGVESVVNSPHQIPLDSGGLYPDWYIFGNSGSVQRVPEPDGLALLLAGFAGVLCWAFRKSKAARR